MPTNRVVVQNFALNHILTAVNPSERLLSIRVVPKRKRKVIPGVKCVDIPMPKGKSMERLAQYAKRLRGCGLQQGSRAYQAHCLE